MGRPEPVCGNTRVCSLLQLGAVERWKPSIVDMVPEAASRIEVPTIRQVAQRTKTKFSGSD